MHKKLIMVCTALASLAAFITAPVASASPVLTSEGVAVAVGAEVKGQNTGNVSFTGPVEVVCSTAFLNMKITANAGSQIKAEVPAGSFNFTGTDSDGDCTNPFGAFRGVWSKLCLETVTGTDNVKITGCGSSATLTTNMTTLSPCKYSSASMTGSFLTNAGATVSVSGQEFKLEEGGISCLSAWKLDMDLDLTSSSGGALTIS